MQFSIHLLSITNGPAHNCTNSRVVCIFFSHDSMNFRWLKLIRPFYTMVWLNSSFQPLCWYVMWSTTVLDLLLWISSIGYLHFVGQCCEECSYAECRRRTKNQQRMNTHQNLEQLQPNPCEAKQFYLFTKTQFTQFIAQEYLKLKATTICANCHSFDLVFQNIRISLFSHFLVLRINLFIKPIHIDVFNIQR